MPSHEDIQKCIQTCRDTANQLRNLANMQTDSSVRDMLTEGAHHVELCIKECEFSVERIKAKQGAAAYAY